MRSVEAHARRRAVVPWPLQRSAREHAAVLSRPGWRGGALQKRTPPCCCALAGVVALCRGARRRAVALGLAWWRFAEAHAAVPLRSGWRGGALQKRTHAAVLLRSGWRGGALQKRAPPCCCALAGVALCRSARCRAVVLWPASWPLSRAARRLAKAVFLIDRKRAAAAPGLRWRWP